MCSIILSHPLRFLAKTSLDVLLRKNSWCFKMNFFDRPSVASLCPAIVVLLVVGITSGFDVAKSHADAESAASAPAPAEAAADSTAENRGEQASAEERWMERVDELFGKYLVTPFSTVLFFDFWTGPYIDSAGVSHTGWLGASVPIVVAWLAFGAIFLTLRMTFINLRSFVHAVKITRGDFDDPDDEGEVNHFQALSSALAATVGLGNIAGVAIAVSVGGPGAVFWMVVLGFFGMTSKFTECTLGQLYRTVASDGRVIGGPMCYLHEGLRRSPLAAFGLLLSTLFALLCIGGSLGGGCAFQISQSLNLVRAQLPEVPITIDGDLQQVSILAGNEWVYGIVMALLVGVVILGGFRRIAATAEKIVPLMCAVYLVACLTILFIRADQLPAVVETILSEAFNTQSVYGGVIGVIVQGFRRAAFSNEAGCGSAAIAHAAAKTKYPIREGLVACLEPFIDTVVICTMTGLVIVSTGVYDTERFPEHREIIENSLGAELTSNAFSQEISWFPIVLTVAVVLFAYSTMISWSYYGERCATFLFGKHASLPYRLLFLTFVFLGSVIQAPNALEFSDLMILSMSVPNMVGLLLLSGVVRRELDSYWTTHYMKLGE